MKQSTSTDYEAEVCAILLDLHNLIFESEADHGFRFSWGSKKRRSAIGPETSPHRRPGPPSQRSLQSTEAEAAERRLEVKANKASSPATPLSFSPSESEEKPKPFRESGSKNKTREQWLEIMDGLVQERELLRREMETAKSNCKMLKASNVELKAKKQELSFFSRIPHAGIRKSLSFEVELGNEKDQPPMRCVACQQPFIVDDQTVQGAYRDDKFQYLYTQRDYCLTYGSGLDSVNHMGPRGIPDLNLDSVETPLAMDPPQPSNHFSVSTDQRSRATEARRRRMAKIREKRGTLLTPSNRRGDES